MGNVKSVEIIEPEQPEIVIVTKREYARLKEIETKNVDLQNQLDKANQLISELGDMIDKLREMV